MNMRPRHCFVVALTLALAVSFLSTARSQAPGAGGAQGDENRIEIKVYDVRDMLQTVKDHTVESSALTPPTHLPFQRGEGPEPQAGGRGGGGRGLFGGGADPNARAERGPEGLAGEILSLIKDSVDRESWVDNGGRVGNLKFLSGQVVVTQTATNHKQIQKLLWQLRETTAQMVALDAHWVLLEPAQLEAVLRPAEKRAEGEEAWGSVREVDLAAIERLGSVVRHRARTTGYNGQTVYVASGPARTVVYDLEAVTGEQSALYSPKTALLHTGALLQARPLITPDAPRVMLDLQSVVSEFVDDSARGGRAGVTPTTLPVRAVMGGGEALDKLNLRVQHLRTTMVVPADKPVLIGGMTLDPGSAGKDAKQLYLIVQATITR